MSQLPDYLQFSDCLNQQFEVRHEGQQALLALDKIDVLGQVNEGSKQAFALMFSGPSTPALPQSIHQLHHPQLGMLEIFLVPISRDAQGFRYEAIFN